MTAKWNEAGNPVNMSVKKDKLFAKRIAWKALGKATCEDVDAVDKSEIIINLEKDDSERSELAIL
jgi:hypothetical protein